MSKVREILRTVEGRGSGWQLLQKMHKYGLFSKCEVKMAGYFCLFIAVRDIKLRSGLLKL